MAESKKIKVRAVSFIDVKVGDKQNCWGVPFECKQKGDQIMLEAELNEKEAQPMIDAGRVVKA